MNNRLIASCLPSSGQTTPRFSAPDAAASYLSDESRLPGAAEKIFFPQSEGDLAAILLAARSEKKTVTVSGGRTGITGGAVPQGGWLVSTEKMNLVLGLRFDEQRGCFFLRCQPGLTLEALNKMIEKKDFGSENNWTQEAKAALELFKKSGKWRFAPDPTEASATIGGMIACNASGARTLHYGPTRNHVSALRVVLADGSVLNIKRGEYFADTKGACITGQQDDGGPAAPRAGSLPELGQGSVATERDGHLITDTLRACVNGTCATGAFQLVLPNGEERDGKIPSYKMPVVKNAAGYFSKPGMDLLDLFIGSEGTLGIVTEIELALVRPPAEILGVIAFFPSEENALDFVRAARRENLGRAGQPCPAGSDGGTGGPALPNKNLSEKPLALEYFDFQALNLLRDQKLKLGAASEIPALPETAHTAIYIELPTTEGSLEKTAEELMALLEACGSSADTAWTAISPEETEKLKKFRHALPETINQRIGERAAKCPGLTKLGTDFAVPDNLLNDLFALYRQTLGKTSLDYVIFGHIGNNHVHVNILPKNLDEYGRGKEIYLQLAQAIVKWGGTVSAEHGIGKIKRKFLELMYGSKGIEEMRAVKRVFDPEGKINPGNMF